MTNEYLKLVQERQKSVKLDALIIFGLVFGWVFILLGWFRYYVLLQDSWLAAIVLGGFCLGASVFAPVIFSAPQKILRTIGAFVGNFLLGGMLVGVYWLVITPIGFLQQLIRGKQPFYEWQSAAPDRIEGWVRKDSTAESIVPGKKHLKHFQFLSPVWYILQHGELFLLPGLIILLLLGMFALFAQSSALAPLIYTLF